MSTPIEEINTLVAQAKELLDKAAELAATNNLTVNLEFDGSADYMIYDPAQENWVGESYNDNKWISSDSCW